MAQHRPRPAAPGAAPDPTPIPVKIDGWRYHVADAAASTVASAARNSRSTGMRELGDMTDIETVSVQEAREVLLRKDIVAAASDAGEPRSLSSVTRWTKQNRIPSARTAELVRRRAFVARRGGLENLAHELGASVSSVSEWQSGRTNGFRGSTATAFQRAQMRDARERTGKRPIAGATVTLSTTVEYRTVDSGTRWLVSEEHRGERSHHLSLTAADAETLATALHFGDHATATALMEARLTTDYGTFGTYGDAVGVHFLEVNVLDIKWH
ncbi:hypothetical protein [Nocardia brasiliensis]|uniref:hypothetical protein n=1 Tax=Nocardia brasiliensis TaxID=37326 RepID=UPI00245814CF|nr:hypothetical protein [Nocardia brasiliensis]